MNIDKPIRTPVNQMPIAVSYTSLDRKLYRDNYCIECGHPFIAISDKFVTISDGGIAIEMLRENERVLEARCRYHYCKQYYKVWV